jgi:hypothetical protein
VKRTISFLLALAFGSLQGPGTVGAQEISLGLIAGGNVADQAGEDVRESGTSQDVFGFVGGGFIRDDFSSRVGVELEVLYAMKGGKQNQERVGSSSARRSPSR